MSENLAYEDTAREELHNGQPVAMSPRPSYNHTRVASRIFWIFENYLNGHLCTVIADGTDLFLDDENRFVPDAMIVCDRSKLRWNGVYGAPDLVVEVLSPGTAKRDKGSKKDAYASAGVREYWIVSPGEKSVEQYLLRDGSYELHAVHTLYPAWMLDQMTEEEKAEAPDHFQCSLFDDLDIALADIFNGMLPEQ